MKMFQSCCVQTKVDAQAQHKHVAELPFTHTKYIHPSLLFYKNQK